MTATTAATSTLSLHDNMTKFASKAITSINYLSVNHDTRANASTQSNNDKIFQTTCHAIGHLTNSSGISVVGKRNRYSTQPFREHISQRHHAIVSPNQVRSKLNRTIIVVAVRCTDTHSFDGSDTANLLNNDIQSLKRSVNIVSHIGIGLRFNGSCSLNLSTAINDAKYRVCST